jgi:hypothetical protein
MKFKSFRVIKVSISFFELFDFTLLCPPKWLKSFDCNIYQVAFFLVFSCQVNQVVAKNEICIGPTFSKFDVLGGSV